MLTLSAYDHRLPILAVLVLAIPVVLSKLNETLYSDEFVTPRSVQVLYSDEFVTPSNIQVLYNDEFAIPNSVDVLYNDEFVTPSNTLVLYRLEFVVFICFCASDVRFCVYENVCAGTVFSVLVKLTLVKHALKQLKSCIVLISA